MTDEQRDELLALADKWDSGYSVTCGECNVAWRLAASQLRAKVAILLASEGNES